MEILLPGLTGRGLQQLLRLLQAAGRQPLGLALQYKSCMRAR